MQVLSGSRTRSAARRNRRPSILAALTRKRRIEQPQVAAVSQQWATLSHDQALDLLRQSSPTDIETIGRSFLQYGDWWQARTDLRLFYFAVGELVDERLDKYNPMRPDYSRLIQQAVADQEVSTFELLVFSLKDRTFLRHLLLTSEEKLVFANLYRLLND